MCNGPFCGQNVRCLNNTRGIVMRKLFSPVAGIVLLLMLSSPTNAAIQLQEFVTGLTSPVFVTNAHDGTNRLFIVEQGGVIKVLQPGSTTPTVFLDITSKV